MLVFPTNEWSCDAPGLPKKTIGSSGARCVKVQLDTKFTPRSRSFMRSFESSPASADDDDERGDGERSERGDDEQAELHGAPPRSGVVGTIETPDCEESVCAA